MNTRKRGSYICILIELFWLCSEENFQCIIETGLVVLEVDTDTLWAWKDECLRVLEEEKRNKIPPLFFEKSVKDKNERD